MAERLKEYQFTHTSGRRAKYPWDEWLDNTPWRVVRGVDFEIETENFRNSIRAAAHKRGLGVWTELEDENTIVFETHDKEDTE